MTFLAAAAVALLAAAGPPPAELDSSLSWAAQAYSDPAGWRKTVDAARERRRLRTLSIDQDLQALIGPGAHVADECGGDIGCFGVLEFDAAANAFTPATFEDARRQARLILAGALATAHDLDARSRDDKAPPRERLQAFARRDQALRGFYNALYDDPDLGRAPEPVRSLAVIMIRMELRARDLEAARYLSGLVAESGWPTADRYGQAATDAAWLIAEHADRDPVFQVRALKAMQVTLNSDQPTRDYAFLHDRVQVAIGGKQRYATQIVCTAGHYRIAPTEQPDGLDARRARLGLGPIADRLDQQGEPC